MGNSPAPHAPETPADPVAKPSQGDQRSSFWNNNFSMDAARAGIMAGLIAKRAKNSHQDDPPQDDNPPADDESTDNTTNE
jgi:hypothetical protein